MPTYQDGLREGREKALREAIETACVELEAAAKELGYANDDRSTFAAGNKERAQVRHKTAEKIVKALQKLS